MQRPSPGPATAGSGIAVKPDVARGRTRSVANRGAPGSDARVRPEA